MSQIIRNDGKDVRFPQSADGMSLRLQTVEGQEYSIEIRLGWHGTNVVRLTSDYRVQVSGFTLSEPQKPEFIIPVFESLGFVFEKDSPRSRVQSLRDENGELRGGWKHVMAMAGHPEPTMIQMSEGYETTPDGLVYTICIGQRHPDIAPVLAREVRREAGKLISAANRWLHQNLRSFKRAVKLTPYQAVELYMRAKNSRLTVVDVELGSTVDTKYWDYPTFGSGGGWCTWTVYGEVSRQGETKNSRSVVFDKGPAVVFSAAGDRIGEGRNFYRILYVVTPTGDLAERANQ